MNCRRRAGIILFKRINACLGFDEQSAALPAVGCCPARRLQFRRKVRASFAPIRRIRGEKDGKIRMSSRYLRYKIIENVKLLASDGRTQLDAFPAFVCRGEELAGSLDDLLVLYEQRMKRGGQKLFGESASEGLNALDKALKIIPPEDYSDFAVMYSIRWDKIRKKARETLGLLGEPVEEPEPFTYVSMGI